MTFLLIVIFILMFLYVHGRLHKLDDRLAHMEKYLQEATQHFEKVEETVAEPTPVVGTAHDGEPSVMVSAEVGGEVPVAATQEGSVWPPVEQPSSPSVFETFFEWLKADWLMKLGGLLIVLGLAWMVNYAFTHDWIGDMGKIAFGLIIGTLIVVLGRYRLPSYPSQGSILMFVGVLGIILTIWAGREYYGFFGPVSALVLMFLASSLLGVTSVVQKRVSLAYANVFLGAVVPMLTTGLDLSVTVLFTYLFVLALSAVAVAVITNWRGLILASLMVVYAYSLPYLGDFYYRAYLDDVLLFVFGFTALYFLVSMLSMVRKTVLKYSDILTAVLTGLFLLQWVVVAGAEEWQALYLVMWTLVFGFGAFSVVRFGANVRFFYAYAGVGALLLAAAMAVQLEGPALTIALLFESLLILFFGYEVERKVTALPLLALPTIVPLLLSLGSMNQHMWGKSIMQEHSLVLVLVILSGLGVATHFRHLYLNASEEKRSKLMLFSNLGGIVSSVYGICYIWLASHALLADDNATILSLLIYIGIGSQLYLSGRKESVKWKRVIGATLIGLTSMYLILVAGVMLGVFGRVVAFMLIGIALVAVAWHERNVSKAGSLQDNTEA